MRARQQLRPSAKMWRFSKLQEEAGLNRSRVIAYRQVSRNSGPVTGARTADDEALGFELFGDVEQQRVHAPSIGGPTIDSALGREA